MMMIRLVWVLKNEEGFINDSSIYLAKILFFPDIHKLFANFKYFSHGALKFVSIFVVVWREKCNFASKTSKM